LAVRQCGVRLEDTRDQSFERSLLEFFGGLDSTRYSIARTALAQVPLSDLLDDKAACDRFGKVLGTLSRRY
jgi:hypothetical protein